MVSMKGITFGNYHSYDDFGLILSSKEIGSPEPKIITIDVEGGDGVLDFTEFAGEKKFKNRTLTFHFQNHRFFRLLCSFFQKFTMQCMVCMDGTACNNRKGITRYMDI